MKTATSIIGAFICSILIIGVVFKIMHWPGGGLMIIFSSSLLALYVYLVAITNILNHKKNILLKISNGLGALIGSIVIVGFLFKIMHWPGAGVMLVVGLTLCPFILLLFMASFIISKEPIKFSSGTFFSIIAFGTLAFGVATKGPSYNILTGIVGSNQQTETIISKSGGQLDWHSANTPNTQSYVDAGMDLHKHIKKLKSKLYESTDRISKEIADTISLASIMAKDNYDVPTLVMGLANPGQPEKVSGMEEFSATTLKEKIQDFNNKMMSLDSSYEPIITNNRYNYNGGVDSWETATFYHKPLAHVVLSLNLIDAEALTKCNYYLVRNISIETKQDESK